MAPRRLPPHARAALVDAAARVLASHGPEGLSTRRIAAEVGVSTMALYTHFGGISGLIREVVHEAFKRLHEFLTRVRRTDDPVADMMVLGRAYRHNALTNSHLYAVMFGGASLAGFKLTDEDRQHGRYTLSSVTACAARCIQAGRFRSTDAELIATGFWIATHGLVTLELGGYLLDPYPPDLCFESQLASLMYSEGDAPEQTAESLEKSRTRFADEVAAHNTDLGSSQPGRSDSTATTSTSADAMPGGSMTELGDAPSVLR